MVSQIPAVVLVLFKASESEDWEQEVLGGFWVFDIRVLGGKLALQIIDSLTLGLPQDRSGINPVRSDLGSDRSGLVRTDSKTIRSSILNLLIFRCSVQSVRSGPGPMNTPS